MVHVDPLTLVSGREICARLDDLARCSETPGELTRRYLTPEHRRANELVLGWQREAGMRCHIDAVGNVVGRYEGRAPGLPALLLGSHLDTVRNAGRYDGMLGVVTAISCVNALRAAGERLPFAIEVIGFADEEGARFQSTLIGSRAVAGAYDPTLLDRRDADGISLAEAMRAFGLDPDPARIAGAARRPEAVLAYAELHIEQGPVLEAEGLPVGLVTSIAGATRLLVEITGEAGHAGTVPMRMRRDALAAAAEAITAVERRCAAGGPDLVGTVGQIEALPGAVNVIPGRARFSIDVRAATDPPRTAAAAQSVAAIREVCDRRGVAVALATTHESPSCPCAPWLMEQIGAAIAAEGIPVRALASGAGHDATAIAGLTDVGMIFVRCTGGISHHPAEAITAEDAEIGARVLLRFIRRFAPRAGAAPSTPG